MWSLLLDPNTGEFTSAAGQLSRCSRGMAKVISATTTERGSVPGFESWGIDQSLFSHVSTGTPKRIEAELDRILRPLLGVDLVSYDLEAWCETDGTVCYTITIQGPDSEAEESTTVKVSG